MAIRRGRRGMDGPELRSETPARQRPVPKLTLLLPPNSLPPSLFCSLARSLSTPPSQLLPPSRSMHTAHSDTLTSHELRFRTCPAMKGLWKGPKGYEACRVKGREKTQKGRDGGSVRLAVREALGRGRPRHGALVDSALCRPSPCLGL